MRSLDDKIMEEAIATVRGCFCGDDEDVRARVSDALARAICTAWRCGFEIGAQEEYEKL